MAQQARRPPAYPPPGGNGIPRSISAAAARGRANGMDALLHALNERMRNGGGIRISRSLSTSSSGGGSLGSPGSVMSQQHQVRPRAKAVHMLFQAGALEAMATCNTIARHASDWCCVVRQVACIDEDKPLKRLAFVRAQGSFWLTWVRRTVA